MIQLQKGYVMQRDGMPCQQIEKEEF